ncbi:MAG: hypothetical protein ABI457_03225 [Hyphomicrobium sp.]
MDETDTKKIVANKRAARLEAELRANLKKRKDQARARDAAAGETPPDGKQPESDE